MRRNTLNFLVDVVTLLAIFVMIATGLVIRFVLPPGTGGRHGGHGLALWGMGRHDWGDIHFWASVVLGVFLLVHVALHWSWVCATSRRLITGSSDAGQLSAAKRNAYGLASLVALFVVFGGFTWYAGVAVSETHWPENAEHAIERSEADVSEGTHSKDHQIAHDLIRGSMTLAEVEIATGVAPAILKSELGLPDGITADERLGRLSRRYGFDMETVRTIVAEHLQQADR
jgi:hypothetical protein